MVEKHPAAASGEAPTPAQYVAVLGIAALFLLGVLMLIGLI